MHHFDPKDDWHTYAMEWTPDYISWSIDGHEVRHVPNDHPALHNMNKEQSLRMNFWTPTFHSWGHGLDTSDMPWFLLYDYVEVHNWNHDTNEFELLWRDDFDNFDDNRWHKASGGFDANSSVFHPNNVSVKAGNLVLKMEPDTSDAKAEEKEDSVTPHIEHTEPRRHHKTHFDRSHARRARTEEDTKFWLHDKKARASAEEGPKKDKVQE